MQYPKPIGALILCALSSGVVQAATDAEVAELQQMLHSLKQDYQTRITALEERIKVAEARSVATPAPQTNGTSSVNAFNPAISLVLQGTVANYSRNPDDWILPGFQTGGEAGLLAEGLSLRESELVASANVDSLFFAQFTMSFHDESGETAVEVEEAFIDTTALPAGLGMRMGRFYTETGYHNSRHSHAWDFVDVPLVSQAFLGLQYKDDGVRLTWLAPTDLYMELGFEALRGGVFPASGDSSKALGDAQNYFVRIGGDVGYSNSYQIGLSHLRSHPDHRGGFSGDSNLSILDMVWKWAPDGNMQTRNLGLQGEYFFRDESGLFSFPANPDFGNFDYSGKQQGFYLQGAYQFMPRWRMGLRFDHLHADNTLALRQDSRGSGDTTGTDLLSQHDPYRWSLMFDWTPSEFSRLRLQYNRDYSQPHADDQFYLQYIMTIGAHGAHQY